MAVDVGPFSTPEEYIALQPPDRQEPLRRLREVLLGNMPTGFEEAIGYGMVGFVVPHSLYPAGYHVDPKQALPFLGFANQKHFIAFYHLGIYADAALLAWFVDAYAALNIGKLDMGKSCIRFKRFDRIPFELIGELCRKMSVDDYIRIYEANKPAKKRGGQ